MKEFKTIDEQLDILEKRGLQIPNREKAANFLLKNNYYRVSGYSLTLRDHDKFYEKANFQNIIDIYNFDFELRRILQYYLEIIETNFKSIVAYEFTKQYGSVGYLDSNNFSDKTLYLSIIAKTEQMKEKRLDNEPFLKHYVRELKEDIPFWAYVDLFTMANISLFYKTCSTTVQKQVANYYDVPEDKEYLLSGFMHHMTILRNLCAHGSRLFNRYFEQKPKLSKNEKAQLREHETGHIDNDHLFSYILIMKRLLQDCDFNRMMLEISRLSSRYPFVSLKYYGFPAIV